MKIKIKKSTAAAVVALSAVSLIGAVGEAIAQSTAGIRPGRPIPNPQCQQSSGEYRLLNSPEEDLCISSCLQADGENWRVYQYYCQETSNYNLNVCLAAIDLLPIDACKSLCCENLEEEDELF